MTERYYRYAAGYYVKDGKQTDEVACVRSAIRNLSRLYSSPIAASFGPKDLKAIQQDMISRGQKRAQINRHARIIRRMFKWAASEELIPASIFEALRSVDGLKYGRTEAKESEPVRPVSEVT